MKGQKADLWNAALLELRKRLPSTLYETIIQRIDPGEINDDGRVVLGLPYIYMIRRIEASEKLIIENVLSEVLRMPVRVEFSVRSAPENVKSKKLAIKARDLIERRKGLVSKTSDQKPASETTNGKPRTQETAQISPAYAGSLNNHYKFDSFIVGESNMMAHAAAQAVAQRPALLYNPLFIYSGVGLGKTHLLHAIGNQIKRDFPTKVIRVCPAEAYTNELIDSIGDKQSLRQFRSKYRRCDVLLIDDIHFLIDKDTTQEAFFHTFNDLYELEKQIVITSDRPPKELRTLKERLVNRFQLGLIVDIQKPSYETRLAILRKKAASINLEVAPEVLELYANEVQGSIRSLEGCLKATLNHEISQGHKITLDEGKKIAESYNDCPDPRGHPITMKTIIDLICHHYRVSYEELTSPSRESHISHPRHIGMYLARKHTSHSFKEIARAFNRQDHATIYHGVKKIENSINVDAVVARELSYIEELLLGKSPMK